MNTIVEARFLGPDTKLLRIVAPPIARKRKPGQFVIARVHAEGERIPLTIADADAEQGTITLIVLGIGKTTKLINTLEAGDCLEDLAGPLGQPSDIQNFGTAVCIGGGVGTAVVFPIAKALKSAGNYVISIAGGRDAASVILENELRQISDEVYPTTDDGSHGFHGLVTDRLQELIDAGQRIDYVFASGPVPMMQAVAAITARYEIKTGVSLNPIMVDGTGMCGGCRALVNNQTVFVCVDGPEFDAHQVDFDTLMLRNRMYREQEEASLDAHQCKLEAHADMRRA